MYSWTLVEMLVEFNQIELSQRRAEPSRPAGPGLLRRRLAQGLVGIGLRLDADASRSVANSLTTAPRLNGSDA